MLVEWQRNKKNVYIINKYEKNETIIQLKHMSWNVQTKDHTRSR